ncbi:hypothetical protein WHJ69_14540, partial [Staphylococcus aureus]|uniref:hypothetical protein n=1 Tax=Staphylococcus aureus TaxID=1280 RepID=UPI0039BE3AB4
MKDVQAVLSTPDVNPDEVPSFRMSDFAHLGSRISKAIGQYDEFVAIIKRLRTIQVAFSLSEEDVLVEAINHWHRLRNGSTPEFAPVGYLWEQFCIDEAFQRHFKSPNMLSRRLTTLHNNLRS